MSSHSNSDVIDIDSDIDIFSDILNTENKSEIITETQNTDNKREEEIEKIVRQLY